MSSESSDNATTQSGDCGTRRLVFVDLLRGFSICLVLAIHLRFGRFLINSPGFMEMHSAAPFWFLIAEKGGYGVSMFFVLSGFLISGILIKPGQGLTSISFKEFYVRRAARIFPLLIVFCALGILLEYTTDLSLPWSRFCLSAPWRSPSMWVSIATFSLNSFRIANDKPPHMFGLYWGASYGHYRSRSSFISFILCS
jgi:peptidoglycan/LPS O-acetylase OafA/YrhL